MLKSLELINQFFLLFNFFYIQIFFDIQLRPESGFQKTFEPEFTPDLTKIAGYPLHIRTVCRSVVQLRIDREFATERCAFDIALIF